MHVLDALGPALTLTTLLLTLAALLLFPPFDPVGLTGFAGSRTEPARRPPNRPRPWPFPARRTGEVTARRCAGAVPASTG